MVTKSREPSSVRWGLENDTDRPVIVVGSGFPRWIRLNVSGSAFYWKCPAGLHLIHASVIPLVGIRVRYSGYGSDCGSGFFI